MKKYLITLFFLSYAFFSFSQGEWNNWYFGHYAGMKFVNGILVPVNDSPIYHSYATSTSVSDSAGNLLFFSNGLTVWNRNKIIMPHGTGLYGGYYNSQSSFAVPFINDPDKYYLFTVGKWPNTWETTYGLYYSVIDMNLDGGSGDIDPAQKNISIPSGDSAFCQLTATRHKNNKDIWVVVLRHGAVEQYLAYLINENGINPPVISNSLIHNPSPNTSGGQAITIHSCIRISPDGTHLVCHDSLVEVSSFNSITGKVTPRFTFLTDTVRQMRYFEFSIDSRYFYSTSQQDLSSRNQVFQYDMNTPDSLSFLQSSIQVGDSAGIVMQLAPDGKIYIGDILGASFLHVINYPSLPGTTCGFQKNAVTLFGMHFYSLPQFLQRYKAYIHHSSVTCDQDSVHYSADIWPPADSIYWNFGDPASGADNVSNSATPAHVFSGPGTYTVELWVRHIDKRTDTTWQQITILAVPTPALGPDQSICNGDSVVFAAGACTGCSFEWKNLATGVVVGTNQTYTATTAGTYRCQITNADSCHAADTVQVSFFPPDSVNVNISASQNSICAGTSVTYTATPTGPGVLSYQWKVNGINQGDNNAVYSYSPVYGDVVSCILSSSETVCVENNPATSNSVIMVVDPLVPVSVSVAPSQNNICQGTPVTFTATPSPLSGNHNYQWTVNGINAGANQNTFIYSPNNNDFVDCSLNVSGLSCLTNNPDTSPPVTMIVNPVLTPDVTMTAIPVPPVCGNISVTFSAHPVNGGLTPAFQWFVNGNPAATNLSYSYIPANNDLVVCSMNSSAQCLTINPVSSIPFQVPVITPPVVTYTLCTDSITTTNAKPIKLKGGIPLGGTYSGPGVNSITGIFTPSIAGVGIKTINYSYTNAGLCSDAKTRNIIVQNPSASICGNPFTDVRDGKVYKTIQLAGQCWFAEDLNYGTEIPMSKHQRDNCLPEKYTHSSSLIPHSCYQWDELMQYTDTPGQQGLCPPAWHVPTEVEWNTLFTNWTNSGFAASALKYSGFSGFNAILSGVTHQNIQYDYSNFATFYWSSTPHGPTKAWAHGMNDPDPSVSRYPSGRNNAFGVRCIKD